MRAEMIRGRLRALEHPLRNARHQPAQERRRREVSGRQSATAELMETWNYFNYFTEIEEYFWKKRGAALLVSPLDWAIMESWQKAGVPLEAALKGIDRAFESYSRSRRGAGKPLKSLAYCTDAVLDAATEIQEASAGATPKTKKPAAEPFSRDELRAYFARNIRQISAAAEKQKLSNR